ncbi:aminotransferase class I/II-fold pyridoxal phosphate-dependent enzyme [uncultured Selenomonas sp.]|uniref:aminotransferase class I/II-fold pyridoxal phosphate-dependent enzyme n=1 Tax=uncultured Selenomonas sp. TaxID=159275 RepID=UPI0028D7AA32|nr:aminotransferase class I/II-fold pyridoxal phosphate-dependent enzyme [uncultured Selenomonas sp.]
MATQMAAKHAVSRRLKDAIFGASAACRAAVEEHGEEHVTNATIGAIMDDEGKLAHIPTVERVFRSLPIEDYIAYAPISGLPAYLDAAIDITFAGNHPAGYLGAVATAGGTGALRTAVDNYVEKGDRVLTSDWFWGTYNVICEELGCGLTNFKLFDERNNFNHESFASSVDSLLKTQDSLLIILNTPAHNPTGYSLSSADWDHVLDCIKKHAANEKKVHLLIDIAYIDFAGEKFETRAFMQKFSNLPKNILTLFAFSMSKAYTFYGQRCGALIALSSCKEIIDEFGEISKYAARATWSNINRGAMTLLTRIQQDAASYASYEKERDALYHLVQERGDIFMKEAAACDLPALPYKGGFFLAVPAADPQAVCDRLHDDLIFAVPLKMGVRIAACSVPRAKMYGVAEKVKRALKNP